MSAPPRWIASLRALRPDPYILALFGMVALASVSPVRGHAAEIFGHVTSAAIALLFFSVRHKARPTRTCLNGLRDLRLHGLVLAFTYVVFPLLGLCTAVLVPNMLTRELYVGFVFLSVLPSTVQSSIAFTSIARGNVAAALCSASLSNVLGVVITPVLAGLLLSQQGMEITGKALRDIALALFLPFLLGQLLRPLTADFVTRHKRVLGYVDRGSILLVVFAAFSEGVVSGVWGRTSIASLGVLFAISALMLMLVLGLTTLVSRAVGLPKADEIVLVFCGSKKSMASGLPMASVLFAPAAVGSAVLPLMLFHQLQLVVCAWLAGRYRERVDPALGGASAPAP